MGLSTAAAIASLIGTGVSVIGALTRNNADEVNRARIAQDNLAQTRRTQDYIRSLSDLISRRSTAGYQDAMGGGFSYDPTTNTWKQTLGPEQEAVQRASDEASISRNTTDLRNQQYLNELMMKRAADFTPIMDSSRRQLDDFRTTSPDVLQSILTRNILEGQARTNEPVTQAAVTNATRTGTAAGPVLEQLQRGQAKDARQAIMDATIQSMTSAPQIDAARLAPITSKLQAATAGATPSLSYSPLENRDPNTTMAALAADRAKTASTAPAYAMTGLTYGLSAGNTASQLASGAVPSSNQQASSLTSLGKIISDFGKDKALTDKIGSWFGSSDPGSSYDPGLYGYTAGGAGTDTLKSLGLFSPLPA